MWLFVVQQLVLNLIQQYQRAIHFGYEEFPATSNMYNNGAGCCAGDVTPPAVRNFQSIQYVIGNCANGGGGCVQMQRPLADALDKIGRAFANIPDRIGRGRYVIVLTGGDPTC